MSTVTPETTPGFRIQGTFYPDLDFEQWSNDAFTIVRRMMYPGTLVDFMAWKCDLYQYNAIRAAVCMFTARQGAQTVDEVIELIGSLKPSEIVPEGYKIVEVDDADPPDGTTPASDSSSENGKPSSESSPENSPLEASGSQPTPTGSEE